MPRTLHDESRESSFAQRPAQMGAGIVQTVHLTVHLEQGIFPPSYLDAFRTFRGNVLIRRQPDSHGVAYSPRLEKGVSRCWMRLVPESRPRIQSLGAQTPSGRRMLGTPGWLARSCASRRRPSRSEEHTSELQSQSNL